jgi:pyruvate/oxaloacetate carboxyltransferase
MRVAMDAVIEANKVCEGTICYTGDLLDPARSKYDLKYYLDRAKELKSAGAHVLGLKDMAGLMKPASARVLIKALKQEIGLPVHFHTHDTSGAGAATILAACDAGVDAVDAAMDAFSGGTSQPCLGSIVEALRNTDRDTGLDIAAVRQISDYWEAVRKQYAAFESGLQAPASEVYLHEMPGGQFTNLKAQARSLGLEERWHEVAQAYADANQMFGDIVKVTPSSKVVGDMALMMVAQGLTRAQVEDPNVDVAFPDSVVDMLKGNLGQPHGGWPQGILKKVLKGEAPLTDRPGKTLPPVDLEAVRKKVSEEMNGITVDDEDLNGYLMYPKVFLDYMGRHKHLRAGPHPADAGLLLRHAAGRRDVAGDRPRQDAGDPPAGRGRDHRGGRGQGLLRAERPAPRDPGAEPGDQGEDGGAAQGARRQSRPHRRADAGGGGIDRGDGGPEGPRGRPASQHRGDEDGDGPALRPRGHGEGDPRPSGQPDRGQGPADRAGIKRRVGDDAHPMTNPPSLGQ